MSRKNSVRRVLRGGFSDDSWGLRTTFRDRYVPEVRYKNFGFRIVVIRRKQ